MGTDDIVLSLISLAGIVIITHWLMKIYIQVKHMTKLLEKIYGKKRKKHNIFKPWMHKEER